MDSFDETTGEIEPPRRNLPAPSQGERNLIFASPECAEVFGALSEAQGQMGNPKKTKTAKVQGTTKSGGSYSYDYKYAPLEEVMDVIRKPLAGAGLVHRQFLAQRDGVWVMRTIIAHRSGQWYGCDYPIFAGRQEGAQGFASGVTYARRYGLMLALGIVGEDDDDANVADGRPAEINSGRRRPETPSGGTTAQGSPERSRSAPQRQQTAPARSEGELKAIADRKRLAADIGGCMTVIELETIPESLLWSTTYQVIRDLHGDAVASTFMAPLGRQLDERRSYLLAEADRPFDDSPLHPGEMG